MKTFWQGESGWAEQQFADGSIVWTAPSGRRYTTTPGGSLFFPQTFPTIAVPTAMLRAPAPRPRWERGRTLMMPTRRRSREEERAARICWERSINERRFAADPPPF